MRIKNYLIKMKTIYAGFVMLCLVSNGHIIAESIKDLAIVKNPGIGPAMDLSIEGTYAYIIGGGKLFIFDITSPGDPQKIGEIAGLGNVRQITVRSKTAYITSREDGVYIVNASTPSRPEIICHYNTIEVATGICLSSNVMFIANRTFGVEAVDVTDPKKPEYLGLARTGEAQSLDVLNGYLYAGIHGEKLLAVVDARNPREMKITSRVELDGQGDGIYIQGKYLYISTGNNSRSVRGAGHGLEIFKLGDPAKPEFVSRVKFDPIHCYPDLWSVEVSGDYAFCADTRNGFYLIDVRKPETPSIIGRVLPDSSLPPEKAPYIGGLGVVDGYIYLACQNDLLVAAAPDIARKQTRSYDMSIKIPVKSPGQAEDGSRVYQCSGQVYAAAFIGDVCIIAAGMSGIRTVQLWPDIKELGSYKTDGFAFDAGTLGDYAYVADGSGKVSAWKYKGNGILEKVSVYENEKKYPVLKLEILPSLKKAMLQSGMSTLEIIDLENPDEIKKIFIYSGKGYINRVLGAGLLQNRYVCAAWHVSGLCWFDVSCNPPVYTEKMLKGGISGAVCLDNSYLAFNYSGLRKGNLDSTDLNTLPIILNDRDVFSGGDIARSENTIIIAARKDGLVTILDITQSDNPKIIKKIPTKGNPGKSFFFKKSLIVPDGYEGLRVYDNF